MQLRYIDGLWYVTERTMSNVHMWRKISIGFKTQDQAESFKRSIKPCALYRAIYLPMAPRICQCNEQERDC